MHSTMRLKLEQYVLLIYYYFHILFLTTNFSVIVPFQFSCMWFWYKSTSWDPLQRILGILKTIYTLRWPQRPFI